MCVPHSYGGVMTKTLQTALEIKSWDEKPYREFDDGRKFTRAEVQLGGNAGIESATFEALMYYGADGTGSYVMLMHITATLGGRTGSFLLRGSGGYDGTTAASDMQVVAGSGIGELAGLQGTATSASTKDDYPNMPLTLTYDIG